VNLVVVVEPYNGPPTATLTGPTRGEAGRELQFSAESPADPDGDPLTFRWDFGDGQHASGPSSSHVYATPGHYAVTLNMSDGRQSVSYTQLVLVDPYRAPGASPLGLAGAVAYVSAAVILACAAISGWMLLFGARRAGPSPAPAKESQGLFGKDDEEE
jgi:PKD repeat protein